MKRSKLDEVKDHLPARTVDLSLPWVTGSFSFRRDEWADRVQTAKQHTQTHRLPLFRRRLVWENTGATASPGR